MVVVDMLTFAILGLAGCAMALVALVLDWRDGRRIAMAYWTSRPVGD